ncbi:MAG: hypothetical protein Satyrvirus25_12 [Satyrvirus sp.]|uniref:Uncharacterized protein n=1 Tax=Satyrvirus sp. TaxID=2487771 RepID=A0A3G5AEL3_9VIRU|nr:MAG: hypothetical protein Satyrvirus25_12 [Satyrvirus sp.]
MHNCKSYSRDQYEEIEICNCKFEYYEFGDRYFPSVSVNTNNYICDLCL